MWRDVPQVLQSMWRSHLRLHGPPAEVAAQEGMETAITYALRSALRRSPIRARFELRYDQNDHFPPQKQGGGTHGGAPRGP